MATSSYLVCALLDGPVPAPPGAMLNRQDQRSPEDPTYTVEPGVLAR